MTLSEALRNWLLEPVLIKLKELKTTMSMNQADLDSALAQLGTIVTNEDALIQNIVDAVNALIAKIQAGSAPADLTTEVTAIQAMVADVTTQTDKLTSSVATAKGVTG